MTGLIFVATALPAWADIEPPPEALGRAVLVETTATVEAIDVADRFVTLKGPEGKMVTVRVGEQVKNLDQVEVGDLVRVEYYRSMAVNVAKPGEEPPTPGTQVKMGKVTAERGEMPAGVAGRKVRTTVLIVSVDPYKKTIMFRGPDDRIREVSMDAPHLEHYLKELKDGDTVEVVYVEALAVSVEPQ